MGLEICSEVLAKDLAKNCANPIQGGIEMDGWIFNADDIDVPATFNANFLDKNAVEALIRLVGKKGYRCTNLTNIVKTKVDGTFDNIFQKVVSGAIMADGSDVADIVEALGSKSGKFIMVVENKDKDISNNGLAAFEIIGLESPLNSTGQSIVNDKNSADTRGGWAFSLACNEVKPAYYVFDTDYATTKVLVAAFGTPQV